MKEGIHPNYQQTTITCACGNVIETGSTKANIKVEEKVIPMEENKLKTVEQPRDRVVLVGLSSPVLKADSADEESMDELAALV